LSYTRGRLVISRSAPLRPTGIVLMAIAGTVILAVESGIGGLIGGLVLTGVAVLVSLSGVSRLAVYENGLELGLGPLGFFRTFLPRQNAVLRSRRTIPFRVLAVASNNGQRIGLFRRVQMWDYLPEDALRAAHYQFVDSDLRKSAMSDC
jgi:hypothetical protein